MKAEILILLFQIYLLYVFIYETESSIIHGKNKGKHHKNSMKSINGSKIVRGKKLANGTKFVNRTKLVNRTKFLNGTKLVQTEFVNGTKLVQTEFVNGTKLIKTEFVNGTKLLQMEFVNGTKLHRVEFNGTKLVNGTKLANNGKDPIKTLDWSSLDARPLPQWYDAAKIGIMVTWGVYSVPAYPDTYEHGSEWFLYRWRTGDNEIDDFLKEEYRSYFSYDDFINKFKAQNFQPKLWSYIFEQSGAKYVILTAKHHDGFPLFPSKTSLGKNAEKMGPKKDLVRLLSKSVKARGLKFGIYYSLFEWFNNRYLKDKEFNFTLSRYVDTVVWPDIGQLIFDYKPSILWADGDWEASETYWKSKQLIAWLYNKSPVKDEIVVNDRWGYDTRCLHGDFFNCDVISGGKLGDHKWENAFSLDTKSFGYRSDHDLQEIMSFHSLLSTIVSTVSYGGNALINIGATKEGIIPKIFVKRLFQLGKWMSTNSQAIYNTSPWYHQQDSLNSDVWYTCKKENYNAKKPVAFPSPEEKVEKIYAIFLSWPPENVLKLKDVAPHLEGRIYVIDLLDPMGLIHLKHSIINGIVEITLPERTDINGKFAWVVVFK